ncbi:MAG: sugar ABC transporter permease [Deltaproteobacteria bacterium]|jgi:arabinogalactan oligomer/maltooligosaccharide transport system permease protein|nr:sugar ABC transporter permease [Deltaproteobacteria bacterium]
MSSPSAQAPSPLRVAAAHALLVVACAVVLYPVLWVLKMALTPSQAFSMDPSPFPTTVSLQNFRDVLGTVDAYGEALFWRQLANSVIVALVTSALGVGLSCTAAYAMSRMRFFGREASMQAFLITQMFPGVVMLIPLYILLDTLGLLDSLLGLALVYSTTSIPFCTWNLKGYFDTIPRELEEAALMDGADRWTTFTTIVLPLARPALAVTALFSFMTAWNEFILAATLMSDERAYTLPVVLQKYVGDFSTEWGRFAAGAVLVSIPVMALFFLLQKQLVDGLTAGGVKG